jgi:3D (Asp-Asp-Asp) domain-containing protein
MHQRLFPFLTLLLVLAQLPASEAQQQDRFSLPSPKLENARKLSLWATHYYLYPAMPATPDGVRFRDRNGTPLSDPVSPLNWCRGAIEGSIRTTKDGQLRTINFAGTKTDSQVDCAQVLSISPNQKPWIISTGKSYFAPSIGNWGDGVNGFRLAPFRSAAVDKSLIPYGSVIFIPSLRGQRLQLQTGQSVIHDGYLFAADTGGAIKGNHIDIFCGDTVKNCMPTLIKSDQSKVFDAFIMNSPELASELRKLHQ